MSITGGPSMPAFTLADAVSVSAGATWSSDHVNVEGRDWAVLEVITNQLSNTMTLRATGRPTPPTDPPLYKNLRQGNNDSLVTEAISSGAQGDAMLLDVRGLRWIKAYVVNGSASTATVSVYLTLE